jgi:tRNA threonylcarbamoyladenosine biosynthesis protein TsaB
MNILAFDCSTETLHLGVQAGDARHCEAAGGGAATSALLLPQAIAACAAVGLRLDQLDAIAFGQGPGAFTGVRAACAAAQGLAYGLGKPVVEVPTLDIVAHDARLRTQGAAQALWVLMDARMGEIYAARYDIDSAKVPGDACYAVISPRRWLEMASDTLSKPGWVCAGNARSVYPELSAIGHWIDAAPRAESLLALACERAARSAWVAPAAAAPLYVRNRVALTTREREAGAVL